MKKLTLVPATKHMLSDLKYSDIWKVSSFNTRTCRYLKEEIHICLAWPGSVWTGYAMNKQQTIMVVGQARIKGVSNQQTIIPSA